MHISSFTFSAHALERILDMGLDGDEVRACLEFPTRIHPSHQEGHEGRELYYGERITCVVAGAAVVTVVWRTAEAWEQDIAAGGYQDRSFKKEYWGG